MERPIRRPDVPSIESELYAIYNVPHDKSFHEKDERHLNSVSHPPVLTLRELKRVQEDVYALLVEYANGHRFSLAERKKYYSTCPGGSLNDRTLPIFLYSMHDCTVDLLMHLQQLLAESHANWRIVISSHSANASIIIYPDSLRFGQLGEIATDIALTELIRLDNESLSHGQRLLLRQYDILGELLRRKLGASRSSPVEAVAIFDNWRGE